VKKRNQNKQSQVGSFAFFGFDNITKLKCKWSRQL
jgi:hypothetical protein